MDKGRLEAFSDGVIAILITIMVLELKIPEGTATISLALFVHPWIGAGLYVIVALIWLVPDTRIETRLNS